MVPLDVLARYGLGPILETTDWGGTAGRTFRITTEKAVYFLRRRGARSSSPQRIGFDHGLRRAMIARGIPTAAPIGTADGSSWVAAPDGVYELYPFVSGRSHRPGDIREIECLAGALAAFHAAGVDYRRATGPSPLIDQFSLAVPGTPASGRIDDPDRLIAAIQGLARGLGGAERQAARGMAGLAREVSERFGGAAYADLDRHVIHGDFHPANLVFRDDGAVAGIFDLDWATNAPRLRDLADALHFFASPPTVERSDIWSLTAPRRPSPDLARAILRRYHAALPLRESEITALRWAWLGRWLSMHAESVYKVPVELRGRFLTAGVMEMADTILGFDVADLLDQ